MLSAARMARMGRLLDEALELGPEARWHWLEALSPSDRDLEAALRQALLPEEGQATGTDRLGTLPKIGPTGDKTQFGSGLQAGELVGPYRLMRPLGAGGMAEVWLAQRADGAFKREVALKLPMVSGVRQDLASRFARERDILASLEHPNIARLYDAGLSPEGLPYLAMEYVAGQPLTAWADAHQLGLRERLKLFLQVLDAVQYAHARQVVHRDIKPSNILVTESGQVRLLDFGVAKLLAEDDGQQTQLTALYGRALTPDYASPEHLMGEPVDAVSDIYSLGVVLYELLAGARPYRLKAGASAAMLERAIADAQVQRPSVQLLADAAAARATTPQRLARRLRGDLDAIVLKALARSPEQRYASASALADDLQRHLSDEPVEARPDSVAYRTGKYALRHRTGIAMSAAAALAVVAAALLGQSRAPAPAPGVLATSAPTAFSPPARSIAVLPFLNMSGDPKQEYFSDGLSEEVLNSLATIPDLQVAARTSSFFFKGEGVDLAEVARKLNVGAILEGSVRKNGDHVRITVQLINAVTGFHLWSQTYDRELKDILKVQAEIATAVTKALQAKLLADAVAAIEVGGTQNPQALDAYLRGVRWRGNAHKKEDLDTAIAELSEAIRLDPAFAKPYSLKASFLFGLASHVPESAVHQIYEEARAAAQRAVALAPAFGEAHAYLAHVLELGFLDFTRAAAEYDRALALSPGDARVHSLAALFFGRIGRADEAVAHARRSVALDSFAAGAHYNAGNALSLAHRYREAIEEYDQAESLDPQFTHVARKRGLQFVALGEIERAIQSCSTPPIEWNHTCLAIAYDKLHRPTEAQTVLAALEADQGDRAAYQYAQIYAQWGDTSRALDWIERAYERRDGDLANMKVDYLLDPLREEPRFQAIERKLKFPN
jgi:eukaryotic-like serine/threonine-protein kinase